MKDLLQKSANKFKVPERGQLVEGKVVRQDANNVLIDIGGKSEGIISHRELQSENIDLSQFHVGDTVLATVVYPENDQGYAVLSVKKAAQEQQWHRAKESLDEGTVLEGEISDVNRGGVVVSFDGVSGFIPTSHLASATYAKFKTENAKSELCGTKIKVKVIEINRKDNRLVVSEKDAVEKRTKEQQTKLLDKFKVGEKLAGTITKTAPFGVFVDVGGIEGLVHVSELSWERVGHPAQFYKAGDKVKVQVLEVHPNEGKLALSIKALKGNPFTDFAASNKVGDKVKGKVVKIVAYGIFVDVGAGTDAFLHASEITRPLKVGEEVEVTIKEIDADKKRISLSMKEARKTK